jgi:hypothetical protein
VRLAELQVLDTSLINFLVAEDRPLADVSPLTFRVRKAIVQRLPRRVQDGVARLKSRLMPTGRF